jgi:phage anti-repressor protein
MENQISSRGLYLNKLFEIIEEDNGIRTVNARDLYFDLYETSDNSNFSKWIQKIIKDYEFVEGEDYILLVQNDEQKGSGGHNKKDYHISLDMGKEICMISKTKRGKLVRKYFIQVEKAYRGLTKAEALREAIRITSRGLHDTIKDELIPKIESDVGKKFVYSNYHKLINKSVGLDGKVDRDQLSPEMSATLEKREKLVTSLIDVGKSYQEIKDMLETLS